MCWLKITLIHQSYFYQSSQQKRKRKTDHMVSTAFLLNGSWFYESVIIGLFSWYVLFHRYLPFMFSNLSQWRFITSTMQLSYSSANVKHWQTFNITIIMQKCCITEFWAPWIFFDFGPNRLPTNRGTFYIKLYIISLCLFTSNRRW